MDIKEEPIYEIIAVYPVDYTMDATIGSNGIMESCIDKFPPPQKTTVTRSEKIRRTLAEKRKRTWHQKNFPCPFCPSGFAQKSSLRRHLKRECGQEPRFNCPYCKYKSKWQNDVGKHVRYQHKDNRVHFVQLY
ncbi:PREDICTED: zinc finger protein 711-like [Ceratosolen solmsi marchali]|uniref:Zinc finger protein 711-like n=1 Tax=Ceratosolen solmsi marchali TaxID=326594 RepID=A0AAJ6YWX3_9HYME|nr:PREDICTED: zinc finger protein 711-like [Ceratosolen solmsi marchali]